jgi:N-methylhydantoinase A
MKETKMSLRIGIDTGGTFTDLVAIDEATNRITTAKKPSTPKDPIVGILDTVRSSEIDRNQLATSQLIHGTTVLTNCLIQRKGGKVTLLITKGFEDIPYIQRINRKFHYDLQWSKPVPLVRRRDTIGVTERLNYKGEALIPLGKGEIERIVRTVKREVKNEKTEAVAICFLFSYVNPEHEELLAREMGKQLPDLPLSISYKVAPIWREYERASTTIADAYVKPLAKEYIENLDEGLVDQGLSRKWSVMKSNGGIMDADSVPDYPVNVLLSGPAGGVTAGKHYGALASLEDLITVDMGGTSADVALINKGQVLTTTDYEIEWGIPVIVPTLEISTIGAGGGSIGWVDKGGLLHVGPESAGAEPGPACYDRGGQFPAVTDADLVLGRLNPEYFLGGEMPLKVPLAQKALRRLGEKLGMNEVDTAFAMVEIANENMANAIRLKTIQRGLDPRKFSLMAFGGAGPLHACSIARKLEIPLVIIPPQPGVFSALGLLLADLRVDKVWTKAYRSDLLNINEINKGFSELKELARRELKEQGFPGNPAIGLSMSMRYLGQNYELQVDVPDQEISPDYLEGVYERFHAKHKENYGYDLRGEVIEIISFNAAASGHTEKPVYKSDATDRMANPQGSRPVYLSSQKKVEVPIYRRDTLSPGFSAKGPAVIEEIDSTTFIDAGCHVDMDEFEILKVHLK